MIAPRFLHHLYEAFFLDFFMHLPAALHLVFVLHVLHGVISNSYFLDLAPEHFQRFLLKLFGVFGSFCFFLGKRFFMPSDRAQ
jgi:hypothetical protein